MKWINSLADWTAALLGALVFSQIPAFFMQYIHRLSGHVAELKGLTTEAQKLASPDIGQYIQKFLESPKSHIAQQGEFLQLIFHRFARLNNDLSALQESSIWSRPFTFAAHFDFEVGRAALFSFQPSLTLSFESLIYALIGLGFGIGIYRLLKSILTSISSNFTKYKPTGNKHFEKS